MTYIFTFGIGHQYEENAVKITAPDFYSARNKMIEHFGLEWAFQYTEEGYYEIWKGLGQTPYPIKFEFEVSEL